MTDTTGAQWSLRSRHADIERWVKDGMTRGQIAAQLGVSRNAVCGYVHRRLGKGAAPIRPKIEKPKAPPKPQIERQAPAQRPKPPLSTVERARYIPAGPGVAFMDLERGDRKCRWPVPGTAGAAMVCCGAETPVGKPYCVECNRVGWMPRVRVTSGNASRASRQP